MMTQKLVDKLLARYQLTYKCCKRMPLWACHIITELLHTNKGVCHTAFWVYDEYIYQDDFIAENCSSSYGAYWCVTPRHCKTKQQLVESLQYRINILQSFKEN